MRVRGEWSGRPHACTSARTGLTLTLGCAACIGGGASRKRPLVHGKPRPCCVHALMSTGVPRCTRQQAVCYLGTTPGAVSHLEAPTLPSPPQKNKQNTYSCMHACAKARTGATRRHLRTRLQRAGDVVDGGPAVQPLHLAANDLRPALLKHKARGRQPGAAGQEDGIHLLRL